MRMVSAAAVLLSLSLLWSCSSSPPAPDAPLQSYIVQLAPPPLLSYTGGVAGLTATSPQATGTASVDAASPASRAYIGYLKRQQANLIAAMTSALGRPIAPTYTYFYAMDGMAVRLTAAEAARVAGLPGVASVHPDQAYKTLTPDTVPPSQH